MTKRYRIFSEFTAQAHNLEVVYSLLRRLEKDELSGHEAPAVAVFMAFTIESYLNSIGERKALPKWRDRSSWRDKIRLLHKAAGKAPDWTSPHLLLAADLFQIRDRLAHCRSETAESHAFETFAEAQTHLNDRSKPRPKPDWLVAFDRDVSSMRVRFERLLAYLAEIGGMEPMDFLYKTIDYVAPELPKAT